MNKNALLIAGAIVIVIIGIFAYIGIRANQKPAIVFDPSNATYTIDGNSITLVNGKASAPAAPGSATQVTTSIFGQPVSGDLNGDGTPDAVLILVQEPGGSGTFYYVAAAINTATGTQGTNAILLGDRIAPQTITITNGKIIANYADRKPTDPMTTPPSVGVSKYLAVSGTELAEIAPSTGL